MEDDKWIQKIFIKSAGQDLSPLLHSEQTFWAEVAEVLIYVKRKCDVCQKVLNPAKMARHQRMTGHNGWTESA